MITIYIAPTAAPAHYKDCDTIKVSTTHDALVTIWALAKQATREWASVQLPWALEPITTTELRHRDPPADLTEEIDAKVQKFDRKTMGAIVTDALNAEFKELSMLFGDRGDFVELLTEAARQWAEDCYEPA